MIEKRLTTRIQLTTVRSGLDLYKSNGAGPKTIVVSDATSRAEIPYHRILANRAKVMTTDKVLALLGTLSPANEAS